MVVPTSTSYEGNTKQFARIELAPLGEEGRRLLDFFAAVLQFDRLENSVNPKKLSTGNGSMQRSRLLPSALATPLLEKGLRLSQSAVSFKFPLYMLIC